MRRLIVAFLVSFYALTVSAAVQPAGIFTDCTVLQQGEPIRIWGTAAPGEKVTVTFADQAKDTVADKSGNWMVTLAKMPVCAQGRSLVFKGSETAVPVELKDVLVGEVWLAGGQSNMAGRMSGLRTDQADIDNANDSLLRMITIPKNEASDRPEWKITTPQNTADFSASAYYFARNLRETLKVPVGIIVCAVGGTPAEAWMSRKTLESTPDLKRVIDAYDKNYKANFADDTAYLKYMQEYKQAMKERGRKQRAKQAPGPRPVEKMGPQHEHRPCGFHEVMLTQAIPYTVKGAIWYQGENNAAEQAGFHYRSVLPALIKEWREEFQNPDMPFLFVQLATYGGVVADEPYAELRESQSWTEEHVKNTGMIVLTDGGDEKNIHPHSKDKVGYRLSLLARNMVYGEKELICRGPRLNKMDREGEAIELSFKDSGAGLVLKPEAVSAFEICGKDGKFVPAEAKLVNGKIIVSSAAVKGPQEVRYGWKKWFVPTLFNAKGLPASPFRTDDFPPVTKDRYYLDRL
ncbi:MAG: sialate O-acetylesterase [Kiritimatiellales bacterium]